VSIPDGLEHLADLRARIAARAVATALAGLVPLPIVDDMASEAARRSMLRLIARERKLEVTRGAIANLAVEDDAPTWRRMASAAAIGSLLWRSLRKVVLVLTVARQGDEAARTFQIGTLFDHYCQKIHPGGELDATTARRLREAMTEAMDAVRRETVKKAFQHGLLAAARTTTRVPLKLVMGFVRAVTGRREEAVDAAVQAAENEGFISKAARVVSDEITTSGTEFLSALIGDFGERWSKAQDKAAAKAREQQEKPEKREK